MSELTILTVPDDRLRQKAADVPLELDLKSAKADFISRMIESKGVGLAAPQVGILYCFFVMSETGDKSGAFLVRNPQIVKTSEVKVVGEEGCLSIPGVRIPIWRYLNIDATWDDENGQPHARAMTGWAARIFQHEYDHLNGILITDRYNQQNPPCGDELCC